jgi:hypothetical protein
MKFAVYYGALKLSIIHQADIYNLNDDETRFKIGIFGKMQFTFQNCVFSSIDSIRSIILKSLVLP